MTSSALAQVSLLSDQVLMFCFYRNRRMFGFLMGTLQKFKDSEEASKNTEKVNNSLPLWSKVFNFMLVPFLVGVGEDTQGH